MAVRLKDGSFKLDFDAVRKNLQEVDPEYIRQAMKELQIVIYTMIGGGLVGNFAATCPANFYLDKRTDCPYKKRHINQCVEVLKIYAEVLGLDPKHLTFDTKFHNCGIF